MKNHHTYKTRKGDYRTEDSGAQCKSDYWLAPARGIHPLVLSLLSARPPRHDPPAVPGGHHLLPRGSRHSGKNIK